MSEDKIIYVCETWINESQDQIAVEGEGIPETSFDPEFHKRCVDLAVRQTIPSNCDIQTEDGVIRYDLNSKIHFTSTNDSLRFSYTKNDLNNKIEMTDGAIYLSIQQGLCGVIPDLELKISDRYYIVSSTSKTTEAWAVLDYLDGKKITKVNVLKGDLEVFTNDLKSICKGYEGSKFYISENNEVIIIEGKVDISPIPESSTESDLYGEFSDFDKIELPLGETQSQDCGCRALRINPEQAKSEALPLLTGVFVVILSGGIRRRIVKVIKAILK